MIMKNKIITTLLLFIGLSIHAQNKDENKPIGKAKKTRNRYTPYIYENGYLNYNISKIPVIHKNDTLFLNKLKFNAVYSAKYTQKLMYDRFGKWTKEIRPNDEMHPILVWERIKLFENEDQLYSVYAHGEEIRKEIYASVLVFDDKYSDCLRDDSVHKTNIIEYFSEGIKNLSSDENFSKAYWKLLESYSKNK